MDNLKDIITYYLKNIFEGNDKITTTCYMTYCYIDNILKTKLLYKPIYRIKYDNVFKELNLMLTNSEEKCIIGVNIYGHSFFVELFNMNIILYTSYGGRYNIFQWLDDNLELYQAEYDEMSNVDYTYDLNSVNTARKLFGCNNPKKSNINEFKKYLQEISESNDNESFDCAYEKIFGVRSTIDKKTGICLTYNKELNERKCGTIIKFTHT
jgi:hypothetical protein